MVNRDLFPLLVGLFWSVSVGLAQARPDGYASPKENRSLTLSLDQQTEEVATLLEGIMDTSAQAIANPKAPNVRMTTCRVRVTDANPKSEAIFLYQEQALAEDLAKPYRQRFLKILSDRSIQSIQSLSFKPAEPAAWNGFCNQPNSARILTSKDLGSPVCSVILKRSTQGYVGSTPVEGCPANFKGAVRITNQIELNRSGMKTWDRGFNAQGEQVWGAKSESYQYQRSK
ncbi:MAG: chromophore lyase CpcT/CpeT [Aphanocapsa sp. GSE-SYN-MK-11-07L]|jgi:hypothetical protein|nr:chromophore lyase CpcT/CpeT [Aphanocapsa sp. GSE-SYN-MK-11-07L]